MRLRIGGEAGQGAIEYALLIAALLLIVALILAVVDPGVWEALARCGQTRCGG